GLYDAFFEDQDEFERLYQIYEADNSIRKKQVKAIDLFSQMAQERAQTGRIYIQNVDHCNTHSPFDPKQAPVRQSNLCLEIALPTSPLESVEDPNGEIALCTLSAFNLGAIKDLAELESLSDLIVRALDSLLDYQDYPVEAAKRSSMGRRTLGVGVTNMAYYLAKNNTKYSDGSANNLIHRTFEAIQFNLLKASNNLAKEQGVCGYYSETKYAQGILPIDTYKKDVDSICSEPLHLDWEGLRSDIKTHGLRNSTLTALMPCETSSQITNSTNGIEPPRGYVSVKASKDGILKQVVPGFKELRNNYELLWHIPNNQGYLQLVGIMQKFVDQAISANTNYDPARFNEDRVPIKLVLQDLLYAYKMGLKTLYYHNTRDGASDTQEDDGCAGGACKL
ncbi:MAG: ribonucleoside-diphosphate reductase subunit alpha, partial [Gammaproteobacteria bacterium]|nr:ribonucleoside-diphosphate reductase subunit alpha [Gammaproteobacteria bacterium]